MRSSLPGIQHGPGLIIPRLGCCGKGLGMARPRGMDRSWLMLLLVRSHMEVITRGALLLGGILVPKMAI